MNIKNTFLYHYLIVAIGIFLNINSAAAVEKNFTDNIVPDTIDYNRIRLFLEAPQLSIRFSTLNFCAEGFAILYPFVSPSGKKCVLCVDDIHMQQLNFLYETDFDTELWNTFNQDNVGSRSYIKDGLYYRYDRFQDGLIINYEAVPEDMRDVVEKVMKSVKTQPQAPNDKPLDRTKRSQYDMDNKILIRKNKEL